MKISKIISKIESKFPSNTQLDFDNSGKNIIISDNDIKKVIVTLDINISSIDFAIKNNANLIVSHHPIIFHPIKNIYSNILSKKIIKLIDNGISCYSVHTNFDVNINYGMGKIILDKIFCKSDIRTSAYLDKSVIDKKTYGIGNIIELKKNIKESKLINDITNKLKLPNNLTRLFSSGDKNIKKIIIIPGSGSGMIDSVLKEGCDLLITSDLKHDQIVDLLDSDISYFDATHYGVEKHFILYMTKYINSINKNIAIPYFSNIL